VSLRQLKTAGHIRTAGYLFGAWRLFGEAEGRVSIIRPLRPYWLSFLDTYRTMCLAPATRVRLLLEQARDLPIAA